MSPDTSPTPKPSDDELLSALIDGELSGEERARAEALLAENSDAARLFEELRTVSDSVRTLPPKSVGAGFQESVMEAIRGTEKGTPITAWLHRRTRGLVWSALAIAAALMIMFVSGERPRVNREVARKAAPPPELGGLRVDRLGPIAAPETEDSIAAAENRATRRSSVLREKAVLAEDEADRELFEAAAAAVAGRPAEPVEAERGDRPKASEDRLAAGWGGERGAEMTERFGSGRGGYDGGLGRNDGGELGGRKGGGRGGYGGGMKGGGRGGGRGGGTRGNWRAGAERSDTADFYFFSQAGEAIQRCVDHGAGVPETKQLVDDLAEYTPQGEPLLVVQVDLSPSAVQTQAFDKVLVRNTIRPERPDIISKSGRGRGESDAAQLLYDLAREPAQEVAAVVVEATPEQLHATLNDLQADVSNCLNLKVHSNESSPAAQRQWNRYDREHLQFSETTKNYDRDLAPGRKKRMPSPLGRAQRVQLVPPDQNRKSRLGVAAATKGTSEKREALEKEGEPKIAGPVAKPDDARASPSLGDTERRSLKQKQRADDWYESGRLLAADRARAVFLLRIVPPESASAPAPATPLPAKP